MRTAPLFQKVDAVTVHRYAFLAEEDELVGAEGCAAVGAYDAMPGDLFVGRCKDASDDARSLGINFGVGPHRSSGNGSHAFEDACGA